MFYGDNVQDTATFFFQLEKISTETTPTATRTTACRSHHHHPEYQAMLETPAQQNDKVYFPELGQTNPFLHMGLHLAIREQINTDRPLGIQQIYKSLLQKYTEPLTVEHLMIDSLAECLWEAQRDQSAPDEKKYLTTLHRLL